MTFVMPVNCVNCVSFVDFVLFVALDRVIGKGWVCSRRSRSIDKSPSSRCIDRDSPRGPSSSHQWWAFCRVPPQRGSCPACRCRTAHRRVPRMRAEGDGGRPTLQSSSRAHPQSGRRARGTSSREHRPPAPCRPHTRLRRTLPWFPSSRSPRAGRRADVSEDAPRCGEPGR